MNARKEWGADRHGAILEQLIYTWAGAAELAGGFADDYLEQCLPHAASSWHL